MPFNREWTKINGTYGYEPNRNRTGPPTPPSTGTVMETDGNITVATQNEYPEIPPATPVTVTFPGPNEPLVGADGRITPRWWRFLDELYRRTGGTVDNINRVPRAYLLAGAIDTLVLSGQTPASVMSIVQSPTVGSLALVGQTPASVVANITAPTTVSVVLAEQTPVTVVSVITAPLVGSLTLTGEDADRTVA